VGVLTSSIALHLIVVGFFGFGIPAPVPRPARPAPPPVSDVNLIEEVELTPAPPAQDEALAPEPEPVPASAELNAPPAAAFIQPIAAVPVSVPVAFGIQVKGPVRLVDDAASASGAVAASLRPTTPVAIDGSGKLEKSLLLPDLAYPREALLAREAGIVRVEFRATATGDVRDARVHTSSGVSALDQAALTNVQRGRWIGAPGHYVKRFEFRLN
jgi:protein TonB